LKRGTKYGEYFLGLTVLMLTACASCSRPHTTQRYQHDGIQFQYYSDWKVAKDAPAKGNASVRAINVEGPEHAVVSLICVPSSSPLALEEFAAAVAKRRDDAIEAKFSIGSIKTADVSKGTSEPTAGKVAGQERPGILQHFSINLLSVQVPHEATFYEVPGTRYKIMVMSQVATAKAAATHQGSELILSTLAIEDSR
jgi:hypothetical protein